MLQYYRQNPPPDTAPARPGGSDPWKAAGDTRGNDQGVWILSYLDVMMILFAFFVLLFAYQKAMAPADKPVAKPSVSSHQAKAMNKPKSKASSDSARSKASAEPAMSAMRAQSALSGVSRQAPEAYKPPAMTLPVAHGDSLAVAARQASAQTGQWISQALQNETQNKQVEVLSAGHGVRLELNESILFAPASADLKGGGEGLLDRVLPVLQQQTGIVYVEGHTDSTPIANSRYPSNWELSTARATAVTRYLIARGISSDRIRAVGLADTQPRSGNESAESRARNRRVTLVLGDDQSAR